MFEAILLLFAVMLSVFVKMSLVLTKTLPELVEILISEKLTLSSTEDTFSFIFKISSALVVILLPF